MKKLFLLAALCVAAAFSSCSKHDNEINHVEPPVPPETTPLAIAFAEGNFLQFDVDETKTVHYTITGGSDKTVVKAELQKSDDAYTVETTPTSATEGTIAVTAKTPESKNCVIVTVSDGNQSITAEIIVSTNAIPEKEKLVITFAEGDSLEFDVNETKTIHYTITGGSDKTVVTAKMQTPDNAYAIETTPISATEGTITITAQTPSTENCVIVTVSDDTQSVTAEIAVSTNPIPEKEKLAITFDEGNTLEFNVGETQTVHYTITGGSDKTVVKAEMQTANDAYTVETTPASATEGTITIMAQMPTDNRVIVTVSDEDRSITAIIDVTLKAFDGKTVVVVTPGTLSQLLSGYDKTKITELTVIGNLNDEDIATLKNLSKLAVLDMENANLEVLPSSAFSHNKSLTFVKLPTILKTIGSSAFDDCRNLISITIPDSVTAIESWAFSYCCGLTNVKIGNSVTEIGYRAFESCNSLTSVTISDSVTTIKSEAFCNCTNLTNITIGNSVATIGDSAFYGCSSLTSVYITDTAKWCAIDFGHGISQPLSYASCKLYLNGELVTELVIPDSVTSIEFKAFYFCNSLTSVTIGNSVTTIGGCAFECCSSLTSITIPDSVTEIGNRAFALCSSLTSIYCKAQTPPSVEPETLYNVSTTLYVPTGCKAAYAAAVGWSKFTIIETEF